MYMYVYMYIYIYKVGDLVLRMLEQQQKEVYADDERVVWIHTPQIPISTFRST